MDSRIQLDRTSSSSNACDILPLELWRIIFELGFEKPHLVRLALTCRTFQFEAEAILYRKIELETSAPLSALHTALTSPSDPCLRRTLAARTFSLNRWGSDPSENLLNTVLRLLVGLKSLHLRFSYEPERVLVGCTFQLVQFSSLFPRDSLKFHPFLRTQTGIEYIDIGYLCQLFAAPREGLLPRVRKLRAGPDAIAQFGGHLGPPLFMGGMMPREASEQVKMVTHLAISFSTYQTVIDVLRLFGPQLVSLSIAKPNDVDVHLVMSAFTPQAFPRLAFLEIIMKMLPVSLIFQLLNVSVRHSHGS